jgi:hypothetical protein
MDEEKVEVLGMCEVRWNQAGETDTHDGKRFFGVQTTSTCISKLSCLMLYGCVSVIGLGTFLGFCGRK